MSVSGWIAVDLDGTLAEYNGWRGLDHIGAPVPLMVDRVKKWLAEGVEVRIFTARVAHEEKRPEIVEAITKWCVEHVGQPLKVTNVKDFGMIELWDDRAVRVKFNQGIEA